MHIIIPKKNIRIHVNINLYFLNKYIVFYNPNVIPNKTNTIKTEKILKANPQSFMRNIFAFTSINKIKNI